MIVAVGLLGPLPRSDNTSQANAAGSVVLEKWKRGWLVQISRSQCLMKQASLHLILYAIHSCYRALLENERVSVKQERFNEISQSGSKPGSGFHTY